MNVWVAFLTGLTTGGLTCLAVQGGLLTSVVANQKKVESDFLKSKGLSPNKTTDRWDWLPIIMFLLAKLVAYTILGFLLGFLGSLITMTLSMRVIFQVFTGLFMLATAMNLLNVHPIFRYVVFQPPKFLRRLIKKGSQAETFFAPIVLGLLTIFIPCGVTQAMEVAAINSGQALTGAAMMFAFVLGTMPLFAILGYFTARLSETFTSLFNKVVAGLLIAMALYTLNGALVVMDAPFSVQKIMTIREQLRAYETGEVSGNKSAATTKTGKIQRVTIEISNRGYYPEYFQVKAGEPVELKVKTNGSYSCANAFTFKAFNIFTQLQPVDEETFTFTPEKKGKFTFACSMGMYTGVMEVI